MEIAGIIGLGLIGGSLAKALKTKAGFKKIVAMNRSEKALTEAAAEGFVDLWSTDDFSIFSDCDIIFVCVPVDKICLFAEKLIPFIRSDCVLTDVGSTKGKIADEMAVYTNTLFLGGHPMAGSEKSGYGAASEFLFENAFYVLTPDEKFPRALLDETKRLVKDIGAIPVELEPHYHDRVVAAVSHAPHVLASAIVTMVRELDGADGSMHELAAGGFKDITRIASADAVMWQSICMDNKEEILNVLQSFRDILLRVERQIAAADDKLVHSFFADAKEYRDSFQPSKGSKNMKTYEVYTDIVDKPGSIATIATLLSVNNINIKNIGIVNNREFRGGVLQISLDNEEGCVRTTELLKNMNFIVYE